MEELRKRGARDSYECSIELEKSYSLCPGMQRVEGVVYKLRDKIWFYKMLWCPVHKLVRWHGRINRHCRVMKVLFLFGMYRYSAHIIPPTGDILTACCYKIFSRRKYILQTKCSSTLGCCSLFSKIAMHNHRKLFAEVPFGIYYQHYFWDLWCRHANS